MKFFVRAILMLAVLLPGFFATGCSAMPGANTSAADHEIKMAPMSMLPQAMQSAPTTVSDAYRFALANSDALKNVPCYCGCGAIGHKSNYACYIKQVNTDGTVVFDPHALGCSLCVDIAQEVMKLSKEGKSPGQIHEQVVATFSSFGPPNQ
ncbi:MAG: PCYCGC motif-containing (lipo)protein [Anaerolineae bacterium]